MTVFCAALRCCVGCCEIVSIPTAMSTKHEAQLLCVSYRLGYFLQTVEPLLAWRSSVVAMQHHSSRMFLQSRVVTESFALLYIPRSKILVLRNGWGVSGDGWMVRCEWCEVMGVWWWVSGDGCEGMGEWWSVG